MKKKVKNNVSWLGYIDWELESFHGDDYSIMNGLVLVYKYGHEKLNTL